MASYLTDGRMTMNKIVIALVALAATIVADGSTRIMAARWRPAWPWALSATTVTATRIMAPLMEVIAISSAAASSIHGAA
jgi:hypothetical protein